MQQKNLNIRRQFQNNEESDDMEKFQKHNEDLLMNGSIMNGSIFEKTDMKSRGNTIFKHNLPLDSEDSDQMPEFASEKKPEKKKVSFNIKQDRSISEKNQKKDLHNRYSKQQN